MAENRQAERPTNSQPDAQWITDTQSDPVVRTSEAAPATSTPNPNFVRAMQPLAGCGGDPAARQRRLLADLARFVGPQARPAGGAAVELPEQMRRTLDRLLAGDSEKQIAAKLGRSKHTVHVYVKALYRRFGVSSRAELLARWVRV